MFSQPIALLRQIEALRGSRVIAYLTCDQTNSPFVGRMALDTVPFFYEHLRHVGRTERLDIFLYSQGGDTIVPWRLVSLARERCRHLAVLIPYKAHSAATLLALGANEIVMGEMGELSPIDPSIATPFNPRREDQPQGPPLEISTEDVAGFFNFARDRLHVSEDHMIQALQMLVGRLHPLALGSVYRSHALIRMIADNLLSLHMTQPTEAPLVKQIVDNLAEKLYYHNYFIGRQEAKQLGLKVEYPSEEIESLMWELFQVYRTEMGLGETFDPNRYVGETEAEIERPLAILDSVGLRSCFRKRLKIQQRTVNVAGERELVIQEQNIPWYSEAVRPKEDL